MFHLSFKEGGIFLMGDENIEEVLTYVLTIMSCTGSLISLGPI